MTHHWEALGWTLVHFLWQGAAVAIVYRMADRALARHSANARYVLALAALLGMLAVSVTPSRTRGQLLSVHSANRRRSAPLCSRSPAVAAPLSETARPLQSASLDPCRCNISCRIWIRSGSPASSSSPCAPSVDGGSFAACAGARTSAPRTRCSSASMFSAARWESAGSSICASPKRIASPFTAGVLRPWILLPVTALTGLSSEQLEVVLFHELAHIRRADYLWNLLQTMVETALLLPSGRLVDQPPRP